LVQKAAVDSTEGAGTDNGGLFLCFTQILFDGRTSRFKLFNAAEYYSRCGAESICRLSPRLPRFDGPLKVLAKKGTTM
jgi:hypothetical protein